MTGFDFNEFRRALGCFITGVTVAITRDRSGRPRGFTANSFSSVSLDPPLVSICIDRGISSYTVFDECSEFSINILGEQQKEVSNLFASKRNDKFDQVETVVSGATGALRLRQCVAGFDCVPYQKIQAGDHLLLIGEVREFHYSDISPLSFCRGNYISFDLMQQVISQQPGHELRVGCILGDGEGVFLVRDAELDSWTFPISGSMGSVDSSQGLYAELKKYNIDVDLNFLFSVFDGPGNGQLSIFYRGEASPRTVRATSDLRFFPYSGIPWNALPHAAYRNMLRRYIEERRRFRFGVYVGSVDQGAVVEL